MGFNLTQTRYINAMIIHDHEIELNAIRGSGPGGQHVNKVATSVHLRFDIWGSSLPNGVKARLMNSGDSRITEDGVIVMKSSEHRTLTANKRAAVARLKSLIQTYAKPPKRRIPTHPGRGAVERRLKKKTIRSGVKAARRKPNLD
jgi:ribosome-associated protein